MSVSMGPRSRDREVIPESLIELQKRLGIEICCSVSKNAIKYNLSRINRYT